MADRPVTLAVIIGAHGVAGEVRLKLFTDDVGSLKVHKTFNGGALTMTSVRPGTNGAIARFAEITDRNTVEAMRGTELAVPRDALPPLADGEYYHADLMGLPCVTTEGDTVGRPDPHRSLLLRLTYAPIILPDTCAAVALRGLIHIDRVKAGLLHRKHELASCRLRDDE